MQNLKNILRNKKLMYTMLGAIGGIIVLIIIVMVIINILNKKTSYGEMENQLISATTKYLSEHNEMYPTEENDMITIDGSTLENGKYIKEINKLVKDTCEATVEVYFKNNDYQYKPFLICNKYETKMLHDKILEDNPVVTSGNGLYDLNEMLVFRGDSVKNYFKFNNLIWRIVKMSTDGTIYLILENVKDASNEVWDDRYNTVEESNKGINDYNVSRAAVSLDRIIETKFSNLKSYLVPMDICIAKRSEAESNNTGSTECSYLLEEQKLISLLPLYDYINASTDSKCATAADRGCANYNYLLNKAGKWWTLTADGAKGTKVYGINYSGVISSDYANSKKYLRYMIALDGTNIFESGNGTLEKPYVVK